MYIIYLYNILHFQEIGFCKNYNKFNDDIILQIKLYTYKNMFKIICGKCNELCLIFKPNFQHFC